MGGLNIVDLLEARVSELRAEGSLLERPVSLIWERVRRRLR